MPLKRYGVLKGRAIAAKREEDQSSPHYQVHIQAGSTHYRIAVNVKSQLSPSELLFLVDDDFRHPVTANLPGLEDEFSLLSTKPGGQAVDFIRGNLFDRSDMRLLPPNLPGPDNDLSDQIEHYVKRAMQETDARVYAFGERWGPEGGKADKIFGFRPGNGIHDIHMNQGNVPRFAGDDGVWQDGALMFHFPASKQWVAVFLAFQSQVWHTDDKTGHAIVDGPEPDHLVRIVGALVNPIGPSPEQETVTLLNASPTDIDLAGWKLADRLKNKMALSGTILSGSAITVKLPQEVQLGNKGGIITLLNDKGLKVDGVSYTAQQAQKEGWTIVF
ncbi:MAG: DUF2278 family protein [Nitrospira sp.]